MIKESTTRKHKVSRRIDTCRCAEIGIPGMAECLDCGPCRCSYAIPFGYRFLCKHPRVKEILENTKKSRIPVGA
jgi:hypothetical protein